MRKNLVSTLVALSLGLNAAFVATWALRALPRHLESAVPEPPRVDVPCGPYQKLGVSEEQWRKIEPCLADLQKSARELCRDTNRLRLELVDLLAAPESDPKAIRAKQDEVLASQRKAQDMVVAHLLENKKVLAPEQQKVLFGMIRRQGGCAGHGMQIGPCGGAGGGDCGTQRCEGD